MDARVAPSPANETAAEPATGVLTGALKAWGLAIVALSAIGVAGTFLARPRSITDYFFYQQDLIGAGVALILFAVLIVVAGSRREAPEVAAKVGGPRLVLAVALAVVLVCWAGSHLLFDDYPASADEFLALFDAKILGSGRLAAPLPAEWRGFADALQPVYLSPAGEAHWVSFYLPVNAGFLAIAAKLGVQSLMPALWAGVAVVAAFGVARRLWPELRSAAPIAALMIATSPQVLLTAMTPFAMSAHLAANLVWLWLILRGGRLGHALAMAVAFLATGIHQIIFAPLFAAPFVLEMWLARRWRVALLHTAAFAAILAFWNFYPAMRLAIVEPGVAHPAGHGAETAVDQALAMLARFDLGAFEVMAKNLVRFATWQSLLTIPMALVAAPAAWRAGGPMRALVVGLLLTGTVMFLLSPFQAHGWGYRYFHGLIGSVALLGAWGWSRMFASAPEAAKARAAAVVATAFAASALALTPLRAVQAHEFIAPYAQAAEKLHRAADEVVIVDDTGMWYGQVLVRNDPFLARPVMLYLPHLTAEQVRRVCTRHEVRIYGGERIGAVNVTYVAPTLHVAALRKLMSELGCDQRL